MKKSEYGWNNSHKDNSFNYLINSRSSSLDMHDLVKISIRFADEINFFGYYDKTPWSNLGDYLIFHKSVQLKN